MTRVVLVVLPFNHNTCLCSEAMFHAITVTMRCTSPPVPAIFMSWVLGWNPALAATVSREGWFDPNYKRYNVGVQGWLLQLVAASTFAIIAAALEAHTHEAARRGWALPTQLHKGTIFIIIIFYQLFCCLLLLPRTQLHKGVLSYLLFFPGCLPLPPPHTATQGYACLPACPCSPPPPQSTPSVICLASFLRLPAPLCVGLSACLSLPACLLNNLSAHPYFPLKAVGCLWTAYSIVFPHFLVVEHSISNQPLNSNHPLGSGQPEP